jgi:hypothetical protein
MYLDFMDCPPTMNGRLGNVFPRKAAKNPNVKAADKMRAAPSMGEPDDGSVMQRFQSVEEFWTLFT